MSTLNPTRTVKRCDMSSMEQLWPDKLINDALAKAMRKEKNASVRSLAVWDAGAYPGKEFTRQHYLKFEIDCDA
jgi:hypothetical protein